MASRILTSLVLLILTVTTVVGQNYEPLDLAKKIFGIDSFEHINKYITGEYEGRPNGQDLQKGSITKFSLLGQTESIAVVNLTILDSTGRGLDTYLHFEKDTTWKMSAFRALAMTGFIEQMVIELENMTPPQIDETIEQSKKAKNKDEALIKSREDYDFVLGNGKLTLELDDNIVTHFLKNQSEFERIKNIALNQLENKKSDDVRNMKLVENLKPDYHKLFISSVSTGGYELGNCIKFLIGGILDNTVGYMFVKDKKDLPKMNSDEIIMIREIGNGWYLYKTT